MALRDLDIVTLTQPVVHDGRTWPAGTTGTVVDVGDRGALVEIVDRRGHVDLIAAEHDALALDRPATSTLHVHTP